MFFVPEKGVVLDAFSRTIMETQIKLPLLSQPLFYSFSQKHEFPLQVAMPILHAVLSNRYDSVASVGLKNDQDRHLTPARHRDTINQSR